MASADGLRFIGPVRTLNAGPNPKYFGTGRGITLINYVSDQFSGFKNIVVSTVSKFVEQTWTLRSRRPESVRHSQRSCHIPRGY